MSYANTTSRPNPVAAFGALGVPTAFGAILIAGLAVTHVIKPPIPNPKATDIPDVVITPDIIEPNLPPAGASATTTPEPDFTNSRPDSTFHWDGDLGSTGPLGTFGDLDAGSLIGGGSLGTVIPPIEPLVDPVKATPRGDPGAWILDHDYRPSWIRRGYNGTARFILEVDVSGRVSDCSITGSTGHAQLDEATCAILSERARFNPARDSTGEAVTGRYSSAVNWTIPN